MHVNLSCLNYFNLSITVFTPSTVWSVDLPIWITVLSSSLLFLLLFCNLNCYLYVHKNQDYINWQYDVNTLVCFAFSYILTEAFIFDFVSSFVFELKYSSLFYSCILNLLCLYRVYIVNLYVRSCSLCTWN